MPNRIREAREKRNLSAVEIADRLQIHESTLRNWEAGRRQITSENLIELSDILGFTVDYLLGKDYPQVSLTEPVGKEMLRILHGQPVWTAVHGWMLVNIVENAFVSANLSLIPFDEVSEPVYLIPPALSISLRGAGKPLNINNFSNYNRIWVEPITSDIDFAAELRGWYTVYEKRLVQNEFGNKFYIDTYGAKWLAFESCLEEKG